MIKKSSFARNFKFFRERAHIGQEALAEKIAVNVRTISVYETGKSYPKVDLLMKISEVLKVPIEYFFADDPEKPDNLQSTSTDHTKAVDNENLKKVKEYRGLLNAYRELISSGDQDASKQLINTFSTAIDDLEKAYFVNQETEAKLKFATDLIRGTITGKQF